MAKVNAAGTALVYCGYIGGSGDDYGYGIAVDGSGNAYVTGETDSTEPTFPVTVGPDLTYNWHHDAFVAKVNAVGTTLVYCGYIGGTNWDIAFGIAVDGWGNAYVTGSTASTEATFPVVVGPYLAHQAWFDAFVAKISSYDIPGPAIASLLPSSAAAGGPALVMSVVGADFEDGAVVLWDGTGLPTTFLNEWELSAEIGVDNLTTGKVAQVHVLNPDGGLSSALEFAVATFTLEASPASSTVTAGQSATYTIQLTPQYGSFDASVSFNCTGLPRGCTATFSPVSVTPGAGPATATLTLRTTAPSAATAGAGAAFGLTSSVPPAVGLLLLVTAFGLLFRFGKKNDGRPARLWVAAAALICLAVLIAGCSASEPPPPPATWTPPGTYLITIQGSSGNLTVSTTALLVVQ